MRIRHYFHEQYNGIEEIYHFEYRIRGACPDPVAGETQIECTVHEVNKQYQWLRFDFHFDNNFFDQEGNKYGG